MTEVKRVENGATEVARPTYIPPTEADIKRYYEAAERFLAAKSCGFGND